jgi:cell division control protein 6
MILQKSVLDEVFSEFLKGSTIFKKREALRHDYIPDSLPHREEQIRYLGEMLAPSLKGSICSNILIYGKTGTGKTAVVKFVLSRLGKKAEELGSYVKVTFINCRLIGTEYRIFSSLCSALDTEIPFTGLALGEVFDRFKKALDFKSRLLIVALDEIDAIVKNRGDILLYELTRINEGLKNSKVSIIGISNDLKFKELLDPRVLSTLREEEVVFRPYNANELLDILEERAKIAFQENVLARGVIELCAALAAAEHGDARRALDLLRVAGEVAERRGDKSVNEDHVREAQTRIEHDRVLETLKSLPAHSKIVLLSVYLLKNFNVERSVTGDIYNLYCEICEEMGYSPLTQRRVSGLISELDVMGVLNSRVISLGRYGRTKKIALGIPHKIISNCFLEDERLIKMVNYRPRYLLNLKKIGY